MIDATVIFAAHTISWEYARINIRLLVPRPQKKRVDSDCNEGGNDFI